MHNRSIPKWEFLKIAGTTKTLFQMANNLDDWASILRNPNLLVTSVIDKYHGNHEAVSIINKHTFFSQ
jgi:hypothetical protein